MNSTVKARWVAGLKSKRYRQIRGQLSGGGAYRCAAGVLVDIFILSSIGRNANASWCNGLFVSELEDYERNLIPMEVQRWAGLTSGDPYVGPHRLTTLSDVHNLGFNEIADLIETYL